MGVGAANRKDRSSVPPTPRSAVVGPNGEIVSASPVPVRCVQNVDQLETYVPHQGTFSSSASRTPKYAGFGA